MEMAQSKHHIEDRKQRREKKGDKMQRLASLLCQTVKRFKSRHHLEDERESTRVNKQEFVCRLMPANTHTPFRRRT